MADSKSNDSVLEGMKKLFTQIAQLKLTPDALQHMDFIMVLEQGIMRYLQQQASQAANMGTAGAAVGGPPGAGGPPPGMGGPPGGAPPDMGAGPGAAQFGPGGAAGGGNVGMAPNVNPDELRRVLTGAGGG